MVVSEGSKEPKVIHIGIDGNLITGQKTGMGMAVCSILRFWKTTESIKVTVFVQENLDEKLENIVKNNGISIKILGKYNYFFWEQAIIPRAVKNENISILWCPYNTAPIKVACPTVITLHDVIFMLTSLKESPTLYKKLGYLYRRNVVPYAVKNAKKIITVSNFSKKDICRYFPHSEKKIEIIYPDIDMGMVLPYEVKRENFLKENKIKKPFILGFGSNEKRKNSLGLIKAYDLLPERLKKKYQLVLFGFRGFENTDDYKYIKKHNLYNIVVMGYVSDEEKATLYKESELFVFPTFYEGFGVPVIEAFAYDTPVITSNITSLPEVCGNAAIYIDPDNINMISEAIESLIVDNEKMNKLINLGKQQRKKFSWETASLRYLENIIKAVQV